MDNQILQHVALSVSSLERSVAFYREVFGFRTVLEADFSDETIGSVIGYPGAKCRMVQLENAGRVLELFEYSQPKGQPIPGKRNQANIGFSHIGFMVQDIDAVRQQLLQQSGGLVGDKVEVRQGVFIQYCLGPDREVIELKQLKSRDQSMKGKNNDN